MKSLFLYLPHARLGTSRTLKNTFKTLFAPISEDPLRYTKLNVEVILSKFGQNSFNYEAGPLNRSKGTIGLFETQRTILRRLFLYGKRK